MANNKGIRRGQVWWIKPEGKRPGHIQNGIRPVIVVSNDMCNVHSAVVHVCPCTTSIKRPYPTQVPFILNGNVSIALIDQIIPVNVYELDNMVYTLEDYVMDRIDQAIRWQYGLDPLPKGHVEREPNTTASNSSQVDRFNKKWFPEKPSGKGKKQNRWTQKAISDYIVDYQKLPIKVLCEKYKLSKSTAKRYYWEFTKDTTKEEVSACL